MGAANHYDLRSSRRRAASTPGDEFSKRCNCQKHFRWTEAKIQHRRKAGTRSWAEAEDRKHKLEDQLAGRKPERAFKAGRRGKRRTHD